MVEIWHRPNGMAFLQLLAAGERTSSCVNNRQTAAPCIPVYLGIYHVNRTSLNSQRLSCLCLASTGIKNSCQPDLDILNSLYSLCDFATFKNHQLTGKPVSPSQVLFYLRLIWGKCSSFCNHHVRHKHSMLPCTAVNSSVSPSILCTSLPTVFLISSLREWESQKPGAL